MTILSRELRPRVGPSTLKGAHRLDGGLTMHYAATKARGMA
jgi:hypothetical protein